MIRGLKSYPAYRASGVEWLGDIPEHWNVIRGKWLFNCIDVRSTSGGRRVNDGIIRTWGDPSIRYNRDNV